MTTPRYPGIRVTTNGNQLVSYHTEARITQGGVFYPITPSTEMGENYQLAYAEGQLDIHGRTKIAIEAEGEHAAQGGAIALSVAGNRVVNFTSGQGLVYAIEQYYHAPGKLSTMIVEVAARALTKHALNVHCGHDDIYAALDTGWMMLFAKDAQQAADQALILRRVAELSLNPGINIQDGFLTSHLDRTFYKHESELLREFLGAPDDIIETPTEAQQILFGPTRRRVPAMIDLKNPVLLGPVENQEHYMNGVIARRNSFSEPILGFLEDAYNDFAALTGRDYGLLTEYKTDDASTVFVSLGSAAENIEAAVDYLREHDGAKVGSLHLNVLRPFPEAAVIDALGGKERVIVLERTDEPLSGDNPLTREIRASLNKGVEVAIVGHGDLPGLEADQVPLILSGTYGLGSRDFRPEGIIGAYEFATGQIDRKDGRGVDDGERYFTVGIDHPYCVISERAPSLLPEGAIAVRFHSIGGWGMITTGKNLSEVIGAVGDDLMKADPQLDELGHPKEYIHVSANPKYGSEKKGAPTSYFLVTAPERIRVNCDLHHVDVVLCPDPRIFTHTNPLEGINEGGEVIWESEEDPELVWQRIPPQYRQEIIDKNIKICTLPGFAIAKSATDRDDLRLRMQGNAFLGAFFATSELLAEYDVSMDRFGEIVLAQYRKKFGKLGEAVVDSNMEVMRAGFDQVREVPHGPVDAPDRSSMRAPGLETCGGCAIQAPDWIAPDEQVTRIPLATLTAFTSEYKADLGYSQPASPYAAVGVMAAASGADASKYLARRETPVWLAEKCTQCMDCIVACPDTALPNTAQDIGTVLRTAASGYVSDLAARIALLGELEGLEARVRAKMMDATSAKEELAFRDVLEDEVAALEVDATAKKQFMEVFERVPLAFAKTPTVFRGLERKEEGTGGLFGIMVSDRCKGCGECVVECGEHEALIMVAETEEVNADHVSGTNFLDLLPETPEKYLGRYNPADPIESHVAQLKNHLMVRANYEALVSGDGACAGCGEKSVLRTIASLTEAYMRPLYHAKADRLDQKAEVLRSKGVERLGLLKEEQPEGYRYLTRSIAHLLMDLGGDSDEDTTARIDARGGISDAVFIDAVVTTMGQDAFNHRDLQALDGRMANGMSVMAMGAHTGCNTVYGSTPPNNPHPYPWMNSLFQDGSTVAWLMGESFIMDHARRSVIPERLCDWILDDAAVGMTEDQYFALTHMTDASMNEREIRELPKVWAVGGDGGMGDIGFQNVSKVVLQNRPHVNLVLLDTQVYSNTGGQNSDSSPMPGGGDMNQFGPATEGKLTEKKGVAEALMSGHGSPFVAQVSMANVAQFYKAILDGIDYRGSAFIQSFTTCQPEHGVADNLSTVQANRARDSRSMPQFVYDPTLGETYQEALSLRGNPNPSRDWYHAVSKSSRREFVYTVAHWAATEARFRRHFRPAKGDGYITLEDQLTVITQNDVVQRHVFDPEHRAYVPDFGVTIEVEDGDGAFRTLVLSRIMVLFCVERRRSWRMLQSRAGIINLDYEAQKKALVAFQEADIPPLDPVAFIVERSAAELEEAASRRSPVASS